MDYAMSLLYLFHLHIMSLPGLRTAWISWTYLITLFISVFLVAGKSLRTPGPTLLSNPVVVSHQVGDMAVLFCSVTNLGHHTVTWRKLPSSAPLTIGTDRWVNDQRLHAEHVPNSSQWNLVIEDVRTQDRGQYECQVSHRKSLIRHRVTLQVTEKQKVQLPRIEISGENVIRVGMTLRLTCNASVVDVGVEKIIWVKDGTSIHLDYSNRYKIYTSVSVTRHNAGIISSTLQVKYAQVEDSGVYLCRSTERAQMAGVSVEVQGNSNMKRARNEDSPLREARDYHQTHSSTDKGRSTGSSSSSSSSATMMTSTTIMPMMTMITDSKPTTIHFIMINIIWVASLYLIVFPL